MALTHTVHKLITEIWPEIDYAIDATCGNGHDTLFLAKHCTTKGRVLSFDIQQQAINSAEKRIKEHELTNTVQFICDSHEHLKQYAKQQAQVIMFNLGYLPNADKNITTQTDSTLTALNAAIEILAPNGLLSILCYPGHTEGKTETEYVKKWIDDLNKQQFETKTHQSTVPTEASPILFITKKI